MLHCSWCYCFRCYDKRRAHVQVVHVPLYHVSSAASAYQIVLHCVYCCTATLVLCSIGKGTAVAVQAGQLHVCILRSDSAPTTTASSATASGEVLCWNGANGRMVSHFQDRKSVNYGL
jgi:hypothetical protein